MIDYTLPLDQLPDPLPIEPLTKPFKLTITPPGSKSITCRAYVLAALARGESKIIRPLRAEDTEYLLNALCTLGAEARWAPGETHDGEDVYIKGVAGRFPRGGSVYLGDGGTPTRFMIACACLAAEPVIVDASPRMRERPIAEGVDMLRQLGATIEYVEAEGRLPVRIEPSQDFDGGDLTIGTTASSQSISALVLIGHALPNGLRITLSGTPTSVAYIALTLDVIGEWTQQRRTPSWRFSKGRTEPKAADSIVISGACLNAYDRFWIDGDASSASYWLGAALIVPQSWCHVSGIGHDVWQPDLSALAEMADRASCPDFGPDELLIEGPLDYSGFAGDCSSFPDGFMTIAVLCARALGPSCLTGLRTLRVKETDRIAALANELRKVGCIVETGEDWIEITPPPREAQQRVATVRERSARNQPLADARGLPEPVIIETYNDHRMAMAFAVLGLVRRGISIRNPKCVAKSYPTFWKDFAKLYQ